MQGGIWGLIFEKYKNEIYFTFSPFFLIVVLLIWILSRGQSLRQQVPSTWKLRFRFTGWNPWQLSRRGRLSRGRGWFSSWRGRWSGRGREDWSRGLGFCVTAFWFGWISAGDLDWFFSFYWFLLLLLIKEAMLDFSIQFNVIFLIYFDLPDTKHYVSQNYYFCQ